MGRKISELPSKEVLAVAIQIEKENGERLRRFAETFKDRDPEAAEKFLELAQEEDCHREWLTQKFNRRFKDSIPPVDLSEIEGLGEAVSWGGTAAVIPNRLGPEEVYQIALASEYRAREFYRKAESAATDKSLFLLFRQLATMENEHVGWLEGKTQASV